MPLGKCGDNLTWDLTDGVLTISGSGDMAHCEWEGDVPWYSYHESITSVIIEDGVTSIGYLAFYNCTGLTSVTIGNSVTIIGDGAFYGCSGLTSIEIPNSAKRIGGWAFAQCTGLTSVTCKAVVPPTCGGDPFAEVEKSIPLYVPENSVYAYKVATEWEYFTNIQGRIFEAIENISGNLEGFHKILHDAQILILRGEKT